jgi:hypothetical protein
MNSLNNAGMKYQFLTSCLVVLFLSCSLTQIVRAQHSFGIEYGLSQQQNYGTNVLDSIIVIGENQATPNHLFGVFYEFKFSERLSLHNKLNYVRGSTNYLLYNENQINPFDPLSKIGGLRVHRFSLQVLPQLHLFSTGKFRFNIFGGLNFSADFAKLRGSEFVELPRVEEVYSSLENAHIPFTISIAYGGSIEFDQRLVFWAKFQPNSYFSREINVNGDKFSFENRWHFYSLSLGYKFYSFKLKNSKKI